MESIIVHPLARGIADHVRSARRAPEYGHPVHEELATGTGPCRECLRPFEAGAEHRLLFTHNPFAGTSALAQPGPVFIHAEACPSHAGAGYPEGLRSIPIVAQAYHEDGTIAEPRRLASGDEGTTLAEVLSDSRVRFVNLRHAQAGCFIARAERAE